MTGVYSNKEATLRLHVRAPDGKMMEILGVIDTGFTGALTLPNKVIDELGLRWLGRAHGILADGSARVFSDWSPPVQRKR